MPNGSIQVVPLPLIQEMDESWVPPAVAEEAAVPPAVAEEQPPLASPELATTMDTSFGQDHPAVADETLYQGALEVDVGTEWKQKYIVMKLGVMEVFASLGSFVAGRAPQLSFPSGSSIKYRLVGGELHVMRDRQEERYRGPGISEMALALEMLGKQPVGDGEVADGPGQKFVDKELAKVGKPVRRTRTAAKMEDITGWRDFSWQHGSFLVCFRPAGCFYCPKYQEQSTYTIEDGTVNIDWGKFGKYEMTLSCRSDGSRICSAWAPFGCGASALAFSRV